MVNAGAAQYEHLVMDPFLMGDVVWQDDMISASIDESRKYWPVFVDNAALQVFFAKLSGREAVLTRDVTLVDNWQGALANMFMSKTFSNRTYAIWGSSLSSDPSHQAFDDDEVTADDLNVNTNATVVADRLNPARTSQNPNDPAGVILGDAADTQ